MINLNSLLLIAALLISCYLVGPEKMVLILVPAATFGVVYYFFGMLPAIFSVVSLACAWFALILIALKKMN